MTSAESANTDRILVSSRWYAILQGVALGSAIDFAFRIYEALQ